MSAPEPATVEASASAANVEGAEVNGDEGIEEQSTGQFEVTLLLPTQDFVSLDHISPSGRQPNSDGYLELPIPVSTTDAVQELRSLITESPEGFWLGAFGFVPVVAEEIASTEAVKEGEEAVKQYGPWKEVKQPEVNAKAVEIDPKAWKLNTDGVLGDFCEIAAVFGDDAEFEGKKRGLKVVPTAFSPLATSLHLLRFRDTLFGSLPNLSSNNTYDPSSFAISAGSTIYASVRGDEKEVAEEPESNKAVAKEGAESEETPAPRAPASITDFKLDSITPFAYLENFQPSSTSPLASSALKALAVSPWSPPPHPRRMRGDIAYLTLSTVEGEIFHITAASSGFWVSKSSNATFDPTQKLPSPRGVRSTPYHSLFHLACALSPVFAKSLVKIIESQNPSAQSASDIYANLAISHAIPAASWLTPAPTHVSDPFRTQLAYLLTGSTNADVLPPARDWNDEFGQYYELPNSTVAERLLRERLLHRVQCDFTNAATRGAVSIARGDVPPLNPNESAEAHTFILNNMLFTRADGASSAFSHLGGNDAARVAASKDLAGVSLLEQLDVKGLRTMATVLVDYLGERWVVQSLIPGLFKTKEEEDATKLAEEGSAVSYPEGDESAAAAAKKAISEDKPFPNMETVNKDDYPLSGPFRIVYGSAAPEEPGEKLRASAYFGKLAKQVAEKMHFAEHEVSSAAGERTKLWTSSDMHGIAAPDGRSYFIDCFRLQCTDVEFLENNIEGTVGSDTTDSHPNGTHAPAPYPHRLPLLRPELLEAYHESKLKIWIEEKVTEHRARLDKEEEEAKKTIESELKEAATDASAEEALAAEAKKPSPAYINAADFQLLFNPDAFVERKPAEEGKTAALLYNPEEESSKNVRLASLYLREKVLTEFVAGVAGNGVPVSDGIYLTKMMHRKGINMRYLGQLIELAEKRNAELETIASNNDMKFNLDLFKKTLQHAIVVRSAKHILNRLLASSNTYDHASLIAYFFNCLVGTAPNPSAELAPLPTGASADRAWASLSPSTLRQQVIKEGETRFRYAVPASFFDADKLAPSPLVREIALRVGIQLLLRDYDFAAGSSAAGSSDEAETAPTEPVAAGGKNKKKKKASAKDASKVEELSNVTFRADDVLNVSPIVKSTTAKSRLAEEMFATGIAAFDKGQFDIGQEITQDALNLFEQVFGGVHPENAQHFHTLGALYHGIAQANLRKFNNHEAATEQLKNAATPEIRAELAKVLDQHVLENPDAHRGEAEHFLHSSIRMLRQSVVISERTLGLDSYETIARYTELGRAEQTSGNSSMAIRIARHTLALWKASNGFKHPALFDLVNSSIGSAQTQYSLADCIPLLLECRNVAQSIFGPDSIQVASVEWQLAQVYAMTGNLADSVSSTDSTVRLFKLLLGEEAKDTKEATQLLTILNEALSRETKDKEEREERLKKKLAAASKDAKVPKVGGPSGARRVQATGTVPAAAAEDATAEVVQKVHGEKANLSIDELVRFIQGGPSASSSSKASKKRKGSPPAAA